MKAKKIEIWEIQNDTGNLLKLLVQDSKNPAGYLNKHISEYEGSSSHLVATDFEGYRLEKYHS